MGGQREGNCARGPLLPFLPSNTNPTKRPSIPATPSTPTALTTRKITDTTGTYDWRPAWFGQRQGKTVTKCVAGGGQEGLEMSEHISIKLPAQGLSVENVRVYSCVWQGQGNGWSWSVWKACALHPCRWRRVPGDGGGGGAAVVCYGSRCRHHRRWGECSGPSVLCVYGFFGGCGSCVCDGCV